MLAAVKGYYDGTQIVLSEDDRKNLNIGDEVIVTILDRRLIDSDAFVMHTGRTLEEIDQYIREMRDNDRF